MEKITVWTVKDLYKQVEIGDIIECKGEISLWKEIVLQKVPHIETFILTRNKKKYYKKNYWIKNNSDNLNYPVKIVKIN